MGPAIDPILVLTDTVRVREMIAVLHALEDAGATPVVFKGAALAHTHYGESWRRPRYDADVLIAPESRERVFATLSTLGYTRRALISGELVMYQAPFERIDRLGIEHALDIHWRIVNPQVMSRALTHDELVDRGQTVAVHDYPVRVPSSVDSLLLACVHRVAHHPDFEHPVWIQDIHVLASRLAPSEWRTLVERATSRSIRAICAEGLSRARERFQTEIPPDAMTALNAASGEASAVYLRRDLSPLDRLVADLRALKPFDAARLVWEHLFPPVQYMQSKYSVRRRALLPAYYAVRVLRGMAKWCRGTKESEARNQDSGLGQERGTSL
jgi:hypothetical protein